jgi:hypothetical protein
MAKTLESQWLVLTGPDPINRVAGEAQIGQAQAVAPGPDATTAADQALSTIRDNALARAAEARARAAAMWASLAASAEQLRQGLTNDYAAPPAVDPSVTLTVKVVNDTVAGSGWIDLVNAYHEAIFAVKAAIGFLDPNGSDASAFEADLSDLQNHLASLIDLGRTIEATPPPGDGIYELPAGRDRAAALALLAQAQQRLTSASAIWVASTEDPASAAPYLVDNATLASAYTLGSAVWPGWPDK